MSKIFGDIETKFEEGLHAILTNVGVERAIVRASSKAGIGRWRKGHGN